MTTKDQVKDMTLRDYFAAKAMQGFITNHDTRRMDLIDIPQMAESAYKMADTMLEARLSEECECGDYGY